MYRLENSSAASKTTILLLQAQAIEKQNRIQTKAKHEIKKKRKKKELLKLMKEAEQNNINELKSICSYKRTRMRTKGENKHAVTLSIYTQTTVKTVKLSVQKSTCY